MAKTIYEAYGLQIPLIKVPHLAEVHTAAPAANNTNYAVGDFWLYKSDADTVTSYQYGGVDSSGNGIWILNGPGSSDVDTLKGDSGTATPVAGNINILGGTNITTVGGSPTGDDLTVNLDAAIVLATSVSAPLYTVAAANDLAITGVSGQDVVVTLGDSAGATNFIVQALDGTDHFTVVSDGTITFSALTVTGAFAQTGGTFNVGQDNAANAINIGGGTTARAIAIGNGTGAHTLALGNASAGAITVDTAAGISLDAATASNLTVTGAGQDLTLASAGGSVLVSSTEDAASAIYLHANGGTSEVIKVHADQGTGVGSIYLLSDAGGLTLEATGLASADAINLTATAGGIDVDAALQINIASSQNAADAIRIIASAGGIDVDAVGAAGEDISIVNTGGSLILSATEDTADAIKIESTAGGIDILASGAAAGEDIDIVATGSSINLSSSEADAAALSLQAASGGLDIDVGLAIIGDAAGNIELNSSAGQILIGNDDVDQNASFATDGERTVTVGSTNGAAALVLQAGTGNITVTGTVEEINAKQLNRTGFDITFKSSPSTCTAANTGGVATGTGGDINLLSFSQGLVMEQFMIGTQTIIKPVMDTSGLLCSLDLTNTDGVEYNFGAARTLSEYAFTIGTDAAFFFEVEMKVADISGGAPYFIGFRKAEANNATFSSYSDYYAIGLNAVTSATNVTLAKELNGGGQTLQDSSTAWTGGDGGTVTLKVLVSASGVVTATIDGGAPSTPLACTFDNADVVAPFVHLLHNADAGAVHLVSMKCGYQ